MQNLSALPRTSVPLTQKFADANFKPKRIKQNRQEPLRRKK